MNMTFSYGTLFFVFYQMDFKNNFCVESLSGYASRHWIARLHGTILVQGTEPADFSQTNLRPAPW
jgi:hypothetical protein